MTISSLLWGCLVASPDTSPVVCATGFFFSLPTLPPTSPFRSGHPLLHGLFPHATPRGHRPSPSGLVACLKCGQSRWRIMQIQGGNPAPSAGEGNFRHSLCSLNTCRLLTCNASSPNREAPTLLEPLALRSPRLRRTTRSVYGDVQACCLHRIQVSTECSLPEP